MRQTLQRRLLRFPCYSEKNDKLHEILMFSTVCFRIHWIRPLKNKSIQRTLCPTQHLDPTGLSPVELIFQPQQFGSLKWGVQDAGLQPKQVEYRSSTIKSRSGRNGFLQGNTLGWCQTQNDWHPWRLQRPDDDNDYGYERRSVRWRRLTRWLPRRRSHVTEWRLRGLHFSHSDHSKLYEKRLLIFVNIVWWV